MVLLYSQPKKTPATKTLKAMISSLDYQGLGVAKAHGKTYFIENALPEESVAAEVLEDKKNYGLARARKWQNSSPLRVKPLCPYYGKCGGCQSQHILASALQDAKEQALFGRLSRLQQAPIRLMPMLKGESWHYRRRLRLSIKQNAKTKALEMGFRAKNSNELVPVAQCLVAQQSINEKWQQFTPLLGKLKNPKQWGHAEWVAADNGVALLLRYQQQLLAEDRQLLVDFAQTQQVNLFLQSDTEIEKVYGDAPFYLLDETLKLQFDIRDFIQVNSELNQQMVATALSWLNLTKQDRVLDLFCGMGNFTLPLAKQVAAVVGVEAVAEMVEKAKFNAAANQLNNAHFYQADLSASFADKPWAAEAFDKILLDPPRSGAAFALNALSQLKAQTVLYISCNPATLVRDAEILVKAGYQIVQTAMIDMFPNTAHLESITLFRKS